MFWQWKKKFKDMKLSGKMLLIYLIVAGVTCAISMIGLQASFNIYDRKLYEKSLQELEFFTQQVNDDLEDIENLSYTLAMDGVVQNTLAAAGEMRYLSSEFYYALSPIRKMFLDEIKLHPTVKNAMYMDRENVRISVGMDCGVVSGETYARLLAMCEEARGGDVVIPPTEEFPYQLSGRDILETKNASLRYLGTVIVTSDIAGMLEQKKSALEFAQSMLYVYSEEGMIFGSGGEKPRLPKMSEKQGYEVVNYRGERYFMCYLRAPENGWMYVNYVPYNDIFGQSTMLRYGMFFGLLAIFLVALFVMQKVSRIITSPLHQLTEAIYLVEDGNFEGAKQFLQVDERRDEAGLLAQEFQVMLEKIDSLIHENYEKQLLLKDTKYKMLQAQINPHFLYNTLNAVNWMIKAGNDQEAVKMIVELGNLMRASFSKEPYATVEEEIQAAKSYITIQQFRYKNRAVFGIETSGSLSGYMIPRMILQPLIENAIYYGAEQSLFACSIRVRVTEETDWIGLCVEDEGPGMEAPELAAVRDGTIVPKGHGIGLKNIRERLKIAYEESGFSAESGFLVESEPGRGTKVTIRIPKVVKEKCDV